MASGQLRPDTEAASASTASSGELVNLTPEQVAEVLGGEIIISYKGASSPGRVVYGPRDAITVLMAYGHRVALRDGAYYVDGERAAPGVLSQLAAELEPNVVRTPPCYPESAK